MAEHSLTNQVIAEFRSRLNEERERLIGALNDQLGKERAAGYARMFREVGDIADDSFADLDGDLMISSTKQTFRRLMDVDASLQRIDAQSFGVCTECGAPIGEARLRAEPTTARCLDCQQRLENVRTDATPSM